MIYFILCDYIISSDARTIMRSLKHQPLSKIQAQKCTKTVIHQVYQICYMPMCKTLQTYNSKAECIKFDRDISPESFWCHVCGCTQHSRRRHRHGVTVLSKSYQSKVTQLKKKLYTVQLLHSLKNHF